MPREARLFTSSAGSVIRGYLKFRANIPPRWIKNSRGSRKRIEPEIAEAFRSLKRLRIRRPRARAAIRNAQRELRSVRLSESKCDRAEGSARSRFSFKRSPAGACHNLCDCSAVSQFPRLTPIFLMPFARRMPAARSVAKESTIGGLIGQPSHRS